MSNEEPAKQLRSLAISFMAITFIAALTLWGMMWDINGEVQDLNRKVEKILDTTQSTETKVQSMESQMSDLRISTRSALNVSQFHRRQQQYSQRDSREINYGDQ